jgi:putative FmdB family regulatory protein
MLLYTFKCRECDHTEDHDSWAATPTCPQCDGNPPLRRVYAINVTRGSWRAVKPDQKRRST